MRDEILASAPVTGNQRRPWSPQYHAAIDNAISDTGNFRKDSVFDIP
jgi:hypothetical protein